MVFNALYILFARWYLALTQPYSPMCVLYTLTVTWIDVHLTDMNRLRHMNICTYTPGRHKHLHTHRLPLFCGTGEGGRVRVTVEVSCPLTPSLQSWTPQPDKGTRPLKRYIDVVAHVYTHARNAQGCILCTDKHKVC